MTHWRKARSGAAVFWALGACLLTCTSKNAPPTAPADARPPENATIQPPRIGRDAFVAILPRFRVLDIMLESRKTVRSIVGRPTLKETLTDQFELSHGFRLEVSYDQRTARLSRLTLLPETRRQNWERRASYGRNRSYFGGQACRLPSCRPSGHPNTCGRVSLRRPLVATE
jgi:hypothetical protein